MPIKDATATHPFDNNSDYVVAQNRKLIVIAAIFATALIALATISIYFPNHIYYAPIALGCVATCAVSGVFFLAILIINCCSQKHSTIDSSKTSLETPPPPPLPPENKSSIVTPAPPITHQSQATFSLKPAPVSTSSSAPSPLNVLTRSRKKDRASESSKKTSIASHNVKMEMQEVSLPEVDQVGRTELHHLCIAGDASEVRTTLRQKTTEIHIRDRKGKTPLHYAAAGGHLDIVGCLLSSGAAIEEKDDRGCTPLRLAFNANNKDMVNFLLEKGAKIDAKNGEGETLLWEAVRNNDLEKVAALIEAGALIEDECIEIAKLRNDRELLKILEEAKSKKGVGDLSASFKAAEQGDLDYIKKLISLKKPLDCKDAKGRTLFHISMINKQFEVALTLLLAGAEIDSKINSKSLNVKNEKGETLLHIAATVKDEEHKDILQLVIPKLVKRGASIEVTDKKGRTPFDIAKERGRIEIAKILYLMVDAPEPEEKLRGWFLLEFKEDPEMCSSLFELNLNIELKEIKIEPDKTLFDLACQIDDPQIQKFLKEIA